MIDYNLFPSPSFILDESRLERNLEKIKLVQQESGINVILAFKGFAMWSVFPMIRKYFATAAASSIHEALLCRDEMKSKAHTYMVAYKEGEFQEILNLSSHITFNSLSQYDRFHGEVPKEISIGLRVNPEWSDVTTELYNPSSPQSRLGINAESMPETLPEGIEGLHFHVLCESSAEALQELLSQFEKRFGKFLPQLKWLNMGGGHLITREDYNTELLIQTLKGFREKHDVDIILEPGSAFAWQVGELKSTILDIVENGGVKTAITDISFTCHMPDCLEMPYRPMILDAFPDPMEGTYQYRIGGLSCLAGDYMSEYGFDKVLQVGDLIIFEDMMHYTMVKTTTFNGVHHPAICVAGRGGEAKVIREFGYQDFKGRLS